jgi:2-polyprenyl-3-methyl-5-hydroxy-6-metoxy-1,4-benzoquinol methylase
MIEDSLSLKNLKLQKIGQKLLESRPEEIYFYQGVLVFDGQNDYAQNFGLQWNKFQLTQFDSSTGIPLSENRLSVCTEWDLIDLAGKLVLEIGSGAGRFTEIFKKHGAIVVTLDLSSAIFANQRNNNSENILFVRSSYEELSSLSNTFDYVFCYGVAQHTPDPKEIYRFALKMAKPGAKISIDHYIKVKIPSPFYHPKYIWRPLTRKMNPETLLYLVRWYIPKYIKFDTFIIKHFPKKISRIIRGCIPIPCWNYFGVDGVSQDIESLTEWAIMDTFDALGAAYDYPASLSEVRKWGSTLNAHSFNVKVGSNGVIFNAVK